MPSFSGLPRLFKRPVRANATGNNNQWTAPKKNLEGSGNKFPHAIGALPREGFIGFQNYGGVPVWLRNVRLKPLTDRKPQHTGKEAIAEVPGKPAEK